MTLELPDQTDPTVLLDQRDQLDQKEPQDQQETQGLQDNRDQMHLLENEEVWALLVLQDLAVLKAQQVHLASQVVPVHQEAKALLDQRVPKVPLETQGPQARPEV